MLTEKLPADLTLYVLSFLPFRDTFRRERSLTYQAALRRRRRALLAASTRASAASSVTQVAAVSRAVSPHPPPALPPAEDKIERRAVEHVSVREPARDRDVEKQEATADAVIEQIARWAGIADLAERIVVRHTVGPSDFARQYNSWRVMRAWIKHRTASTRISRSR